MARRTLLRLAPAVAGLSGGLCRSAVHPPAPYGALPSERQLRWHELELYSFVHFTVNTFTGREWGEGDEDSNIFNPTAFDPGQIVASLKAAGMKGVILTCKHHDGFCLWPTRTTEHCIRNSSWRNGKGDVVRDLSLAAHRQGLKFGIYLSPWDRKNAAYGKPEYIAIYRKQLTELLTQYGPVFEVWHDGANGGTGYYGGAREKRLIDKTSYYDWPDTWALVRKLQPEAVIFSDVDPDVRWVGNEKGIARRAGRRIAPRANTAALLRPAMLMRSSHQLGRAMANIGCRRNVMCRFVQVGFGTLKRTPPSKHPHSLWISTSSRSVAERVFCSTCHRTGEGKYTART